MKSAKATIFGCGEVIPRAVNASASDFLEEEDINSSNNEDITHGHVDSF